MKKLICFLLVAFCMFSVFADKSYSVDTKYGVKTVVIPEGYTELNVLLAVSKAYYEQDYEFKEVREELKELISKSETYIEENKKLQEEKNTLIQDYSHLVDKLEAYSKTPILRGIVGLNGGLDKNGKVTGGITVGTLLFDKVLVTTNVNYPISFTMGIGFTF